MSQDQLEFKNLQVKAYATSQEILRLKTLLSKVLGVVAKKEPRTTYPHERNILRGEKLRFIKTLVEEGLN